MAKLKELEERLEILDLAIDSGELSISHMDRKVTYRNLEEMERVRAKLQGRIIQARNGSRSRPTSFSVSLPCDR